MSEESKNSAKPSYIINKKIIDYSGMRSSSNSIHNYFPTAI